MLQNIFGVLQFKSEIVEEDIPAVYSIRYEVKNKVL
jgi:hypothetical protein